MPAVQNTLTEDSVLRSLFRFSVPFLISSFLQTFYGLADLFITGQFNGAASITAVSIGSQLMHMLTVMIVGLAMGSTVLIGRSVGAGQPEKTARSIGNTITLFTGVAAVSTLLLLSFSDGILKLLATPPEAVSEAKAYVTICFAGVPFITAYNVISSIYRGLGDTKTPLKFVAIAGVINIVLDWILIGPFSMGAAGAAAATVSAQAFSVVLAAFSLKRLPPEIRFSAPDLSPDPETFPVLLSVGLPIMLQDGFIQISFLVITVIGNMRGVNAAAGIGIVEKIISFLFLVPSSMLSSVAALCSMNAGAGKHDRSREVLRCGIAVGVVFGCFTAVVCNLCPEQILRLFAREETAVITAGAQYLRTYVTDCIFASVHFCFSGYFSAYGRSGYSFLHNLLSILLFRIPGAYFASVLFPETLGPMGMAAPAGSLFSAILCLFLYYRMQRQEAGLK